LGNSTPSLGTSVEGFRTRIISDHRIEKITDSQGVKKEMRVDHIPENAHEFYPGLNLADHRFAPGGIEDYSLSAVSYGFGDTPVSATKTAFVEVFQGLDDAQGLWAKNQDLVINGGNPLSQSLGKIKVTDQVKLDNVLDLTDPKILRKLNIPSKQIKDLNSYFYTSIIGHIAKRKGYSGILAPSAQPGGHTNLHLLKKAGAQ